MERRSRVSPVGDDLELAERSPDPSPEPRPSASMLPPFRRPRRPAAPPPPSPTVPAAARGRRSMRDFLPRRSLLAPEEVRPSDEEFARGRDSDERKSGEEPESEKPRGGRSSRKKRRSRILSDLRPVDGPESALPSVPAINDDDSLASDDPLEAPDSGERAKEAFAAQRVRMRKSWCLDLRIYMKNAHPFFGICAAHRYHPYKRGDRFLVLFVALLVALLMSGLFAIRDCCTGVLDVPVAVVTRRLEITQIQRQSSTAHVEDSYQREPLRRNRRMAAFAVASDSAAEVQCLAFYEACSSVSAVCAEGSTCRSVEATQNVAECVPDENPSQKCVVGSCPTGWGCNESTSLCIPTSNYLCYLPVPQSTQEEKTAVSFAAGSGGTYTAIEAILQILQIAADNHAAEVQTHNSSLSTTSTSQDESTQQSQFSMATSGSTSASMASAPATSSPQRSTSAASSSSDSGPSSSSSSLNSTSQADSASSTSSHASSSLNSESASGSVSTESSTVKVTLTEPVNGGVYSLSSTMLIEWQVTLLSGVDPGLDTFRVDFSADNAAFDTIATNVSAPSGSASITTFRFVWDLADNTNWLCTMCVLRICALDVGSASNESLCIRSDGQTASNESTRRLLSTTTVEGSSSDVVTFRIVREAFDCSCGVGHALFLLAAVVIAVCIPVVVLFAEPLVAFYRDRQVFGLFARRDGPARPAIAGYSTQSATRKGRALLVVILLALCVACGFVAAQITTTKFLNEKSAIIVLWAVTFAIAVALGVLVYCTLVCFMIFSARWWRERTREQREPSGLSELRSSLLSDNVNKSNESPPSPGWTVGGSEERSVIV